MSTTSAILQAPTLEALRDTSTTLPDGLIDRARALVDKLLGEVVVFDDRNQRDNFAKFQIDTFLLDGLSPELRNHPSLVLYRDRALELVRLERTIEGIEPYINALPKEHQEGARQLILKLEEIIAYDNPTQRANRLEYTMSLFLQNSNLPSIATLKEKIRDYVRSARDSDE